MWRRPGFILFALSFSFSLQARPCAWCVDQKSAPAKELIELAKLSPKKMLAAIRAKGVCVKILKSGRKIPKGLFHWAQVEKPKGELSMVTKHKSLMGKTLCADEHAVSKGCRTIVIADDAPRITLLHEYLHTFQIEKDENWCEFSKSLWGGRTLTKKEGRMFLDKEWDVLKALWRIRKDLKLALEDRVAVASELVTEVQKRQAFDPQALVFMNEHEVFLTLEKDLVDYKKKLGVN